MKLTRVSIKPLSLYLFFGAIFLLAGCVQLENGRHPTTSNMNSFTSPTPTIQPTHTKLTTLAKTPSPSPTARTLTPYPTLSPEEIKEYLHKISEDNKDCKLPCIWGIEMGVTTIEEVNRIYSPLATTRFGYNYSNNIESIDIIDGAEFGYLILSFSQGMVTSVWSAIYPDSSIPEILSDFGKPEEIWIWARISPDHDRLVKLELFYPQQGILLVYHHSEIFFGIDSHPEKAVVCFDRRPEVTVWLPERNLSIYDVSTTHIDPILARMYLSLGIYDLSRMYLSLEEFSGMNIDRFYEIFKDNDGTTCLDTPIEFWESPSPK